MAKKYSITIELIEDVTEYKNFYERISDTGNEKDNGPVYAYVKKEITDKKTSTVFSLELEELDIKKVVSALIL